MDAVRLKNNKPEIGQKKPCNLADEIYAKLNEGNLYEIHKILNQLEDENQRRCVIRIFLEKFDFNFLRYI